MAPTTALGLARAAPLVHGRVWAYTDGAEAVYVDGTVQNIGLRLARDLLQQPLLRPATCAGGCGATNRTRTAGQTSQTSEVGEISEITATCAIAVALSALH